MSAPAYLALDWGTTNRRAYLLSADGRVLDVEREARGIRELKEGDYEREVAALRARFGPLPILAAGMVGSANGWHNVPYVETPATLDALVGGLLRLEGLDVALVPGVCANAHQPPDVMRGEEVQLLGAVAAGLVPADAQIAKPGTHSKWATLAGGAIASFATAMTGEMFALLREHSLLKDMLAAPVAPEAAFREGVRAGRDHDLLTALFGVRASVLLGRRSAADAAAYASGILIGDELSTRVGSGTVHLIAVPPQAALYQAAIEELGGRVVAADAEQAFLTGIHQLWLRTR